MRKYIILLFFLILLIPSAFAFISDSSIKIFAVTSTGNAKDATLNVSIVEGTGRIFSSIDESIVGSTTQESFKNAVFVADKIIGENIKEKYNFTVDIVSQAYTIDGPSAGGAMALLIVSMFEDIELSEKISVTGSVTSDGFIGDVGGIYQKSKKAAEVGIELFFIPKGNRTQIITEDNEIKRIDLIEHAYYEWGLKIIEVSTIQDILKYAFEDIDYIDVFDTSIIETVRPDQFYEEIEYSIAVKPLKIITEEYIKSTENKLLNLKEDIIISKIKDLDILQTLLQSMNNSQELLSISKDFYKNNYFYSAANNAFLAYINVITVEEIISNPSILADSSIIFDIRLKELEEKIIITEYRSNNCSLDYFEWCVGAKQRVTWARDKLENIRESPLNNYSKIQDYSYAIAWTEIANNFLDVSNKNSEIKFVESNHFRELAQTKIIEVENQLILVAPELIASDDLKRRLDAAKRNFERGWYVTSMYDSATALSIIKTNQERNVITKQDFENKYNSHVSILKSEPAMNNKNYVWSKVFLDHAIYYYKSQEYYTNKDNLKADSHFNIANSVLNFSEYLYSVETIVIDFYFNVDPKTIKSDISSTKDQSILIPDSIKDSQRQQNVFVYSRDSNRTTYLYIFLIGLFLMILAIVIEIERFKRLHSKEGLLKQIGHLEEKLIEGKISSYTYNELRNRYISELETIKKKEKLDQKSKNEKLLKDIDLDSTLNDKELIDKLITELKKRQLNLKSDESESIKCVKNIISNIKSKSEKPLTTKKPAVKKSLIKKPLKNKKSKKTSLKKKSKK